jgi:hypothetical protein
MKAAKTSRTARVLFLAQADNRSENNSWRGVFQQTVETHQQTLFLSGLSAPVDALYRLLIRAKLEIVARR